MSGPKPVAQQPTYTPREIAAAVKQYCESINGVGTRTAKECQEVILPYCLTYGTADVSGSE